MNLPTVKQLRYLNALAEHQHFGHAAQACFVSQSALSTAINELEQNLGVVLFERGSTIFPTEIGQKLVLEARGILTMLDNFCEHAKQSKGRFKSDLRFGVIPTIAPFLLPKILAPMRQLYGSNKLFIREDLSPNLIDLLHRGQLDVLLFALPYDTGKLDVEHLFDDPLVLCLPQKHQLNDKQEVSLKDIRQQEILLLEDGHCLRNQTLKTCNMDINNMSVPYQATSLNTLVQMVVNDIGITLLPKMAVDANITHDTNAKIKHITTDKSLNRSIALIWRKNSPRANEFKELGQVIIDNKA